MHVVEVVVETDPDEPDGRRPWVDATVGGDRVRLVLDTGATRCSVPHVAGTAALAVTGTNTGVGASGVSLGEDEVVVPELVLGGAVLRDVAATRAAPGATAAPLLGMSALGRFVCEFRLADGALDLHDSPPHRDWLASWARRSRSR